MPDFGEALKATLGGVNQGFADADRDLHQVVASGGEALAKLTEGYVSIKLGRWSEDMEGTTYALYTVWGEKKSEEILGIRILPKGYPLRAGASAHELSVKPYAPNYEIIMNKDALMNFFTKMASDPDSALIKKTVFLMRNKEV